jgi:hypothetical protein
MFYFMHVIEKRTLQSRLVKRTCRLIQSMCFFVQLCLMSSGDPQPCRRRNSPSRRRAQC